MLRTGNVVRLSSGNIVIVSDMRNGSTHWVSFDYSNSSGITKNESHLRKEMCWDCDINDGGDSNPDCETCKGTGEYDAKIDGMDKAIVLGDNVKDYIIKSLTKNFNF